MDSILVIHCCDCNKENKEKKRFSYVQVGQTNKNRHTRKNTKKQSLDKRCYNPPINFRAFSCHVVHHQTINAIRFFWTRKTKKERHSFKQRHTWRFYTPIAANFIASENRKLFSPPIDKDTLGDYFRGSRRCGSFEKSCDKIAQPDGLALLAIRSNDRRNSRERAHLANLITNI